MESVWIGLRALVERLGWQDPTRRRVLIRGAIGLVGYLVASGTLVIPPIVYDLLSRPELAAVVLALCIPAGQQNGTAVADVLADLQSGIDVLDLPADQKAALVAILDAQRAR